MDAKSAREMIASYQRRMKTGQRCTIDRHDFEDAFPPMDYNGAHWTSADRFMENQVGSAYGTWRVWHSPENGTYTIEKGEEGERRVWTSPDRRDLVPPEQRGGYYRQA